MSFLAHGKLVLRVGHLLCEVKNHTLSYGQRAPKEKPSMNFVESFREARRTIENLLGFRLFSLAESNRTHYNSAYRVNAYASWVNLLKPEQTILNLLKTKPPFKRMLDIGVGAGRTTRYFAEIAEEYIGIDYSENMIKICREKFRNFPQVSFAVLDSRNLSIFEANSFDFVLDSAAIDSVEHEDRMRILHEIWRIVRKGGCFCFSTSNLDAMLQYCRIKLSKHPLVFSRNVIRLLLIRLLNSEMWTYVRGKRRNLEHTLYIIGGDNWGLKTYCITPEAQINQLKDSGFGNIRIYDMQGNKIAHLRNTSDVWLYYLCDIVKGE